MKRMLALLFAVTLLTFSACNRKCTVNGCDNPAIEGGEYCEKHTCNYPGCKKKRFTMSKDGIENTEYCYDHFMQELEEYKAYENGLRVLELVDYGLVTSNIAFWRLENTGAATYSNIVIEFTYVNKLTRHTYSQQVTCDSSLRHGEHAESYLVKLTNGPTEAVTARIVDYEKNR